MSKRDQNSIPLSASVPQSLYCWRCVESDVSKETSAKENKFFLQWLEQLGCTRVNAFCVKETFGSLSELVFSFSFFKYSIKNTHTIYLQLWQTTRGLLKTTRGPWAIF